MLDQYRYLIPLATLSTLSSYFIYKVIHAAVRERNSPFRHLPGPAGSGFLLGNVAELIKSMNRNDFTLQEGWIAAYGPTFKMHGLFNRSQLITVDLKAINHMLMHSDVWQKDATNRKALVESIGGGVLVAEGETHRRQRRVLNPAFGRAQIKDLTEVFISKAIQLRDVWSAEIAKSETSVARIDALVWLGRTTLDIIGLAGFNYDFNSLDTSSKPNELSEAFAVMFAGEEMSFSRVFELLQLLIPILRLIPTTRRNRLIKARQTMKDIGSSLVEDARNRLSTEKSGARDLLSLLVRANMNMGESESRHKLNDQEMLDQIPTFIVAGHETTSSAVTWALFALTQHPDIQRKLRSELLSIDTTTPTMDELNSLEYLDFVIRETLRLYPPVPVTAREAQEDDILPLAVPVIDKNGVSQNTVVVKKGTALMIPIVIVNRDPSIWGPDALEFNPDRWRATPSAAGSIPGVWGNMLTFLGGSHACIGFQFSLLEMKAILFTLVRAFEFELAVPSEDIGARSIMVQRPVILSDMASGNQLPLLVRPYERD